MNFISKYVLAIALTFCSLKTIAEQTFHISSTPKWVVETAIPFNTKIPSKDIEGGKLKLLIEEQYNIAEQTHYTHYAKLLITDNGVQEGSELNFTFDPSYQKLIIHKIVVWRNGISKDITSKVKCRTLHSEEDADLHLYNGTISEVAILEDIVKGDVIECSYSTVGFNPIFEGRFDHQFYLQGQNPIGCLHYRILAPSNTSFVTKNFNTKSTFSTTTVGSTKEYQITLNNIPAFMSENYLPSWYDSYPSIQISEYSNWADVALWGTRLFNDNEPLDIELKSLINKTNFKRADDDKSHQITDAIRYVQNQIRYTGIEIGINSHKPHPSNIVFKQKFGDCKDKALLLTRMLRELGVDAYPALVNSDFKQELKQFLPGTYAFNHVIVKFIYKGQVYWVDATNSNQGGFLGKMDNPPYLTALVLSSKTTALDSIFPFNNNKIIQKETFDLSDTAKPAEFVINTSYYGSNADIIRYDFASNSKSKIEEEYLKFYADYFPSIEKVDSLLIRDNIDDNVIVVEEKYRIRNTWKYSEKNGDRLEFTTWADGLTEYIKIPQKGKRTMPFSIHYPAYFTQQIELNMPSEWELKDKDEKIKNDFFEYRYKVFKLGKKVIVNHHFESFTDAVPASGIELYTNDMNKLAENKGLILFWNPKFTQVSSINWLIIIIALITVGLCIWGGLKIYRFDKIIHTKLVSEPTTPEKIGGALYLIILGLVIKPIFILISIFNNNYFNGTVWDYLSNPISKGYNLLWANTIVYELIVNIIFFSAEIILIILLFKRRRTFPFLFICFYSISFILLVVDYLLVNNISGLGEEQVKTVFNYLIRTAIGFAIWVPYVYNSTRVKKTFTVPYLKNQPESILLPIKE